MVLSSVLFLFLHYKFRWLLGFNTSKVIEQDVDSFDDIGFGINLSEPMYL